MTTNTSARGTTSGRFGLSTFYVTGWRDGLMIFERDVAAVDAAAAARLYLPLGLVPQDVELHEGDLVECVDDQDEASWFEVRSPDFFRYYVASIPTPEEA